MKGCCVYGCKNENVTMNGSNSYLLPKDKRRFKEWTKRIGRPHILEGNPAKLRVCKDHFDPEAIKQKVRYAVPCLNLPRQLPETLLETKKDDDIDIFEESDILALENEIAMIIYNKPNNSISNEEKSIQICETRYSHFREKFSRWQEMMKTKYPRVTYTRKFKMFCLNLYCNAPKAYSLFAKCFSLPSPKSLQNIKLFFCGGINRNLISLLSKQLDKMPTKAKYVALCLYETPLTRHLYYDIRNDEIIGFHNLHGRKYLDFSETALILGIKSLFCNYDQLIAYGMIGKTYNFMDISHWINDTIRFLHENGFVVTVVVSEQNSNTNHLFLSQGVTIESPFNTVEGKKIFFMFDMPHLMNSIRDKLLDCDLLYDDSKMASWQYVKSFYEKDFERKIRFAPQLSFAHIKPARSQRTKVQLMKQVFSYSTAAGISADVESGHLPPEATGTAEFLMMMNNLYDLVTTGIKNNTDKYKNTFTGEDHQIKYLLDIYRIFQGMKAINRLTGNEHTEDIDFCVGILLSMNAVIQLQKYLNTLDIHFQQTARLHVNSTELRSELINQLNKTSDKDTLTPIQLRRSFSKMVLKNIMKNSNLTSCNNHLDSMMFDKNSLDNDFTLILEKYFPNPSKTTEIAVNATDYRFQITSVYAFDLVCSYLLYKCSTRHKCDTLIKYMSDNKKLVESKKSVKAKLLKFVVPPQDLVEYVAKCEKLVICHFDSEVILHKNVGANLLKHLCSKMILPYKPCPCFPLDYLNKLFIRMRIYNNIKLRNTKMKRYHLLLSTLDLGVVNS